MLILIVIFCNRTVHVIVSMHNIQYLLSSYYPYSINKLDKNEMRPGVHI